MSETNEASTGQGWRHATKRRAFVTHLAISASVVAVVCLMIFLVWYPAPYFAAKGAWNVLRILIGVDLVLGPALTLILFKPGKPGLLLDLSMIALIQLLALCYGTTVIYQERPYYVVFAIDRFEILTRRDVETAAVKGTAFERKPAIGPMLVVASLPVDQDEFQRLLEETIFEGKPDVERRPEYWSPYVSRRAEVLARAGRLDELAARSPEAAEKIRRLERSLRRRLEELAYVPVVNGAAAATFVIDSESALPLAVLDVDPWAI
jgi:hypothetical protein